MTNKSFNYDPYGLKPSWFFDLIDDGVAIENKDKGYCLIDKGENIVKFKTGDEVEID